MDVYNYRPDTGEFAGTGKAQLDPLETERQGQDVYLVPKNATTVAPPVEQDGKARVWNGSAWEQVTMYRGVTVYGPNGEEKVVDYFGPLKDGWSVNKPEPTLEKAKMDAREKLALLRYVKETGGITVAETPIKTDRETQMILSAARTVALEDPTFSVDWKVSNGVFTTLDAATVIAVANAVRVHVQACFTNEKAIDALIEAAADVAAVQAVDLEAGW